MAHPLQPTLGRCNSTPRLLVIDLALVGFGKAQAVQVVLDARPYNRTRITFNSRALHNPAEAAALLADYDLVVVATADGSVTHLLEDAAEHTGRRFVTDTTKSRAGRRYVGLPEPLCQLLRQHRAKQNEERLAAGDAWTDGGWVATATWSTD